MRKNEMRNEMNEIIRPARAVAPGRIILRELEERGWSQQDLAAIIGRPEQVISEIIRAKKQITAETAQQLAKAFGTSAEFWLNLEMQYQLNQAEKEAKGTEIERRSQLYHLAPINEMTRRGWIHPGKTIDELEQAYCQFFQVLNVDQMPQNAARFRVSEDRGPENRSVMAWVRRVEQLAETQPVSAFQKSDLPKFISHLLNFCEHEVDIEKIPDLFLENGIHFIIVPHLPKTYLDGAALWINQQPVVALSLRYDRIDAFWFTLLHETAHVFQGHQQIHVDQLFDGNYSPSEEEEMEANQLATHWLIPEDDLATFIEWNRPRYSRQQIEQFAQEHHRHPGIVIGQLMHQGEMKYSHLREYLVKVRPILKNWEDQSTPNLV
jgi:HTH-type transcriptional regulator/antitoxin HigA